MRRLFTILSLVVATSLGLGACATTDPNGTPTTGTPADITAIIAQVQDYCRVACGFVPTATTIANILSGGNPAVVAVSSISEAICAAIVPPKAAAGKKAFVARTVRGFRVTPGTVNGVRIQGQRV